MLTEPRLEVLEDAEAAAARAAELIAAELRTAIRERGVATLALSGGRTPAEMFSKLAHEALPWDRVEIFQVDERVAPDGDPERNDTRIRDALALALWERAPLAILPEGREQSSLPHPGELGRRRARYHAMPVTNADLDAGARAYAIELRATAGSPPILDVVHLGLGADGHTASIFPGAGLDEGLDVAVTGEREGRRRMTLTLGVLNRARSIVWLVTGAEKSKALARLLRKEPELAATNIREASAAIVADAAACGRRM